MGARDEVVRGEADAGAWARRGRAWAPTGRGGPLGAAEPIIASNGRVAIGGDYRAHTVLQGIEPWAYLTDVLDQLASDPCRAPMLTPRIWKERRAQAAPVTATS